MGGGGFTVICCGPEKIAVAGLAFLACKNLGRGASKCGAGAEEIPEERCGGEGAVEGGAGCVGAKWRANMLERWGPNRGIEKDEIGLRALDGM